MSGKANCSSVELLLAGKPGRKAAVDLAANSAFYSFLDSACLEMDRRSWVGSCLCLHLEASSFHFFLRCFATSFSCSGFGILAASRSLGLKLVAQGFGTGSIFDRRANLDSAY